MKQEFTCDIDCNPLLYFSKSLRLQLISFSSLTKCLWTQILCEIKREGRENKGNDRQLRALDYQAKSPRYNLEESMENSLE